MAKNISIYVRKDTLAKYQRLASYFNCPVTAMIREVLSMDEVVQVVDNLINTIETLKKEGLLTDEQLRQM